jgi:hypothetical protein
MNSSPETLSPESQDFLEAVRRKLSDLPVSDQGDLLDQVEQRLRDLDASTEHGAIQTRLGQASDVAADLRAAAGLTPALAPTESSPHARTSAELLRSATRSQAARPVVDYVMTLRPAWWAIRGYILLAGILAVISQGGGYRLHTLGSYRAVFTDDASVHANPTWLLVPAATVIASIGLGLMTERSAAPVRLLITALNVVTVALLIAYPTWWLAPAFASYGGLVIW